MSRRRPHPYGAQLRAMYDNVLREEVPPDFLDFLRTADDQGALARADDPDADNGAQREPSRPVSRFAV